MANSAVTARRSISAENFRAWTIQDRRAWAKLRRNGILRGDRRQCDPQLRDAFRWMAFQMVKRGVARRFGFPVWLWIGEAPDLRHTCHLDPGTRGVRLELKLVPDRVILSHFEAWHCVLNRGYLALSRREDERFDGECRKRTGRRFPRWDELPADLRRRIRLSWERIFDLSLLSRSADWRCASRERQIQGTVEQIRLGDVVSVREFTAR